MSETEVKNLPVLVMALAENELVDTSDFTPEQHQRIDEISHRVDFKDTNSILLFAAEPQQKISSFMDTLLADVKSEDVGVAGDLAVELGNGIDSMHIQQIKNQLDGKGIAAIPLIGPWLSKTFGAAKYFYHRKEKFLTQIDRIIAKAEDRKHELIKNNAKLDILVDNVEDHINELELWIAGGEKALVRGRAEFEAQKAQIDINDSLEAAKLVDFADQINAFETRLIRLKAFYTESIVSIPQIRATQQAGKIEIQNIFDGMLFDLPRLKNAVIRVGALLNIHKAQAEDDKRREASRKIAEIGADMLDQAYTTAKESQGNITEEVDALASVSQKLLDTLKKGIEIDRENAKKRADAEAKLTEVKTTLTQAMKDIQLAEVEASSEQ
ncbi:MAG: toxic anion resistance protein [Alphaproteobacteria bacterium]